MLWLWGPAWAHCADGGGGPAAKGSTRATALLSTTVEMWWLTTFEELVLSVARRTLARHRVEELRDSDAGLLRSIVTQRQSHTYETAVRAWRDLDRDAQSAMTEYVKEGVSPGTS